MRTIKLSQSAWLNIYNDIARNYPHSVLLVRSKMRRVLGFTSRTHRIIKLSGYDEQIHLDFFSENKYTMFLLKYSEVINDI